jgi:cold shock CspA family protein
MPENEDGGGRKLATGRVLQFDQTRGYGFVAADDGGEDVFLHTSVFDGDPDELVPGTKVEFKIMAGDRGRKAFAARPGADDTDNIDAPAQSRPVPAPVPAQPVPATAPSPPPAHAYRITTHEDEQDDEQLCDVLSPTEFGQELTELLLSDVPSLTGQQILDVRQSVLGYAKKHGWVDI